ncbi:hypothetical protein H9L01_05480 [Erysipelothrix inopinata]|uniref:ABC transporter permease n=1 Tax=Erysipelothrix inopinata TaxID=225084 RepID=A0A7G9RW69_9FIRM|nr:hypothetical protein [Erysipelothrix inopinata]QNN59844.1 hypothetical protein H9L01_05480 [Erysipelothrix inopinata]
MKKHSIVFTILVALLTFNATLSTASTFYDKNVYEISYHQIRDGDIHGVNYNLSTHFLDDPVDFFIKLETTLNTNEQIDAVVYYASFDTNGENLSATYTTVKNTEAFNHIQFDRELSSIDFSLSTEDKILTDNPIKTGDNIFHIQHLYGSRDELGFSRKERNNLIMPMHMLLTSHTLNYKTPFSLSIISDFYTEDQINQLMIKEVFNPSNMCGNSGCEGMLVANSLYEDYWERKISFYDILTNTTSITKVVFTMSLIALFSIIFYESFSNSKEIMIRRMNGNSLFKTFTSVTHDNIFIIIETYILTTIGLWIWKVRDFNTMTQTFNKMILGLTLIFILIVCLFYYITYLIFKLSNPNTLLKKSFSSYNIVIVSTLFKFILIFSLILPIIDNHEVLADLKGFKHVIQRDPYYLKRIDLSPPTQPGFKFSHPKSQNWDEKTDLKLIDMIQEHHFGIIKDYYFMESIIESLDVTTVNNYFLNPYKISTLDGNVLDLDTITTNSYIVPKKYQNSEGLDTLQEPIIFVEDTPLLKSKKAGLMVNSYDSKIIYLIVDDYSDFNTATFDMFFEYDTPKEKRLEILEEISTNIGLTSSVDNSVYETFLDTWISESSATVIELTLTLLFLSLIVTQFILTILFYNERKQLAVAYLLGKTRFERYRKIMFATFIPTLISIVVILFHLNNKYFAGELAVTIPLQRIYLILGLLITLDLGLFLSMARTFQKSTSSTVLKGENS